jgi:hypothetical protein
VLLHSAKYYNVAGLCSISPAAYLGNPVGLPGGGAGASDCEELEGRIGREYWGEQSQGGGWVVELEIDVELKCREG